jgi:hypothetical protein
MLSIGVLLFFSFVVCHSVPQAITNLFLSITFSAVLSSIFFQFKLQLDTPINVLITTTLIFAYLCKKNRINQKAMPSGTKYFDFVAALVLLGSALLFHRISNLEGFKLFGLLSPEDNAAWIHASSGLLRFNASAWSITAMQYGSSAFCTTFLSLLSVPTKFMSSENSAVLAIANVANAYVFLLTALIYMSSATCRVFFHKVKKESALSEAISNGKFVFIGMLSVIGVSGAFLASGHLSLILSVVAFWVVAHQLQQLPSTNGYSDTSQSLWAYTYAFLAAFMLGVTWFPLIPVAAITMLGVVSDFVIQFLKSLRSERSSALSLRFLGIYSINVLILISAISQLRIPNGYSISSLINVGSGGTTIPTPLALSLALIGFLVAIEIYYRRIFLGIFFSIYPLGLLAYWLVSMRLNPVSTSYSVEKFSYLIALIGLPLFAGFVFSYLEKGFYSVLFAIVSPVLFTFALLNLSWGITTFPRVAIIDESRWTMNYLPTLIQQSTLHPDAQLLCLSATPELDMTAYTCSRFGSALQFREFSNSNLARRWRSQILGINVDPVNLGTDQIDFEVPAHIRSFIDNGGEVFVILMSGQISDVQHRSDQPWIADLPWTKIKIIQ